MRRIRLSPAGALAILVIVAVMSEILRGLLHADETDFIAFFRTAAYMLLHGMRNVYCVSCQHRVLASLVHERVVSNDFTYANPPLVAFLLIPFALLPIPWSLALFELVSVISCALGCVLLVRSRAAGARRGTFLIIAVGTLPAAQLFALGQIDGLLFLALAGAMALGTSSRWFLAGLALSCLGAKPQLLVLLPAAWVICRSWRFVLGTCAGGIVWALSTLVIIGPSRIASWVTASSAMQYQLHILSSNLPGIVQDAGAGPVGSDVAAAVIIVVTIVFAVLVARKQRWAPVEAIAILMPLTLLATPHALPYDDVLLAPALILLESRQRGAGWIAAIALSAAYIGDSLLPVPVAKIELLVLGGIVVALLRKGRGT